MNIVLDVFNFSLGNIFFLDTKRNIILNGTFTKVIYSNEMFTMNGIFFYLPIEVQTIEKIQNKNIMKFYPSNIINKQLTQELSRIEYKIIEYYKQMYNCSKKTVCSLTKQLYSGNLKIYKEFNEYNSKVNREKIPKYIVKLSGIWENYEDVGLTFKVIECY